MSSVVITLLAITSTPAWAVQVYFNGTQVTGLKNQSFEHCKVRFDSAGNVYISAKGYSVKRLDQGSKTGGGKAQPAPIGVKQYFLYSRSSRPGYAQYDVDVYINGKWARKVRNKESQVVTDITKKLRQGRNVVHFAATKNYGGQPRRSTQASDFIQVFVGLGNRGGGTVNITSTLASFKATAGTTANFGQEQTITVK
jgi:hypothetical protein